MKVFIFIGLAVAITAQDLSRLQKIRLCDGPRPAPPLSCECPNGQTFSIPRCAGGKEPNCPDGRVDSDCPIFQRRCDDGNRPPKPPKLPCGGNCDNPVQPTKCLCLGDSSMRSYGSMTTAFDIVTRKISKNPLLLFGLFTQVNQIFSEEGRCPL